jgi:hypothetical protein
MNYSKKQVEAAENAFFGAHVKNPKDWRGNLAHALSAIPQPTHSDERDILFNKLTQEFPDVPLGVLNDVFDYARSQPTRTMTEDEISQIVAQALCDRANKEDAAMGYVLEDYREWGITAANALIKAGFGGK